ENAIERAVALGDTDLIQAEDLPEAVVESAPQSAEGLQSSVNDAKRQLILATWRECEGDHGRTAARLNIHSNSLRRLIRVLGRRGGAVARTTCIPVMRIGGWGVCWCGRVWLRSGAEGAGGWR